MSINLLLQPNNYTVYCGEFPAVNQIYQYSSHSVNLAATATIQLGTVPSGYNFIINSVYVVGTTFSGSGVTGAVLTFGTDTGGTNITGNVSVQSGATAVPFTGGMNLNSALTTTKISAAAGSTLYMHVTTSSYTTCLADIIVNGVLDPIA